MTTQQTWQNRYLDYYYRKRSDWINGTQQFHQLIQKHLTSDKHVLELGPGPKNNTSAFLGKCFASLDGLDVDEEAKQNPDLRQVYIYGGGDWPIAADSYDAVVADYVLEHLEKPKDIVAEAFRVLRPGGFFFFRTPNLWHYISMVSNFTPHWFHRMVANRLRRRSSESHEPWPTYYRMNRCGTIRRLMSHAGFEEVELFLIEKEPSYGMYSRALFFLFMGYERLVNSSRLFSPFRANILGAFVKPQSLSEKVAG
jgi:SAM-dependent methyltransferase